MVRVYYSHANHPRRREHLSVVFVATFRMIAWTLDPLFPSSDDDAGSCSAADAIVHNRSVVRVPQFASEAECAALIAAAAHAEQNQLQNKLSSDATRLRFEINGRRFSGTSAADAKRTTVPALDEKTQTLANALVRRAIALVQAELPELAEAIGLATCNINTPLSFSEGEPALNVYYGPGGNFQPHRDMQALTLLLTLTTRGDEFEGGGTSFWHPDVDWAAARKGTTPPAALLAPEKGTALLWGGTFVHAGAEVTSGRRVVFVASFTPKEGG